MNYVLEDALNKLFIAYRKACKNNEHLIKEDMEENSKKEHDINVNFFEDEESFEEYILNEEAEIPMSKFDLAVLNEVEQYLIGLEDTDYSEFSDILSLLTLEYYNIAKRDMVEYNGYLDEENEVLEDIENMEKNEFLDALTYLESGYLSEIIGTIIDEYEAEEDHLIEYDYVYLENIIDDEKTQEVYKKFHPNLKEELIGYKKYLEFENLFDKVSDFDIKSLFDFIYVSLLVKNNVDKEYQYVDIIKNKLNLILIENEDLYDEILIYLIKFDYVYLKSKKDVSDIEVDAIKVIEEEARDGVEYHADLDFVIQTFINYNILRHDQDINNISDDVKKKTKKFLNRNY